MYPYETSCAVSWWYVALVSHVWQSWGSLEYCHTQHWRGTRCKIAWLDTLKEVSVGQCGGLNVCHWHSDCHSLTKEDAKLRLERCGELLISRLGALQCLTSYLYTCPGNQIRHLHET